MTPNPTEKWFETNPRRTAVLVAFICILFLELIARIFVATGLLRLSLDYPTSPEPQYWAYVDRSVGMWKQPNAEFRHKNDCFDVTYKSNSLGARDIDRETRSSDSRVMVLGDSMVEGWGGSDQNRFTNILETRTGVPHLNFGASGRFGTIQEWLLYEKFGKDFDHTSVLLFIFPINDFDDNNPNNFSPNLYRPFLRKQDDSYAVYYPVEFDQRNTQSRSSTRRAKNWLYLNFYLLNVLRNGLDSMQAVPEASPGLPKSRYYDFSDEELSILLFSLDRLRVAAGIRPLHIFTIASSSDLEAVMEKGGDPPIANALRKHIKQMPNTYFTDLAPLFLADMISNQRSAADYTLGCDGHWGQLGNEFVANAVLEAVSRWATWARASAPHIEH
jgi:hypothetical protein